MRELLINAYCLNFNNFRRNEMKLDIKLIFIFIACFYLINYCEAFQERNCSDKTLSPYFYVKSEDSEMDALPLKSSKAIVNISGMIADVKIIQIYKNEGKKTLEAIYIFPASTKAAVYGLRMVIGERRIEAKIEKREVAKQIYQNAKIEGRSATLLEQQRPNVFQMNVANILSGDEIKVELQYIELITPEEGIYEFTYPTVVGPRYSNIPEEDAPEKEQWIKSPYQHEKELPTYTFDIMINLSTGLPIQKIFSPSHKVDIEYANSSFASIKLKDSEKYGGNRDFILRYQLSGERIESGILAYESEDENYFLLMIQPPKRVAVSQIPDREFIFIVDVSGSMYGFPLEISKEVIKKILNKLRPSDKFNILLFSGGSAVMSEESLQATPVNISKAINLIDSQKGGGGTELVPALRRALSLPRDQNLSTTFIILTDGYVVVEKEAFDIIRNNLNKANLFAFGIGTSVNRYLIEGMARAGMAESFIVLSPQEALEKVESFQKMVLSPVLTNLQVEFNGFNSYDVEPKTIPDLFAERPIIIFGKWKGALQGSISIAGITGQGRYEQKIELSKIMPSKVNKALVYLWARHKIAMLSDYNFLNPNEENAEEITRLGLKYNLLTSYTSFVAVDTVIRKGGEIYTVKQPLPMPQGVSDYAIGNSVGAVPLSLPALAYEKAPAHEKAVAQFQDKKILPAENEDLKQSKLQKKIFVKVSKIMISNNLQEAEIKRIILKYANSLASCNTQGYAGKFYIKIAIAPNGIVKSLNINYNELKDKFLERCLVEKIKKWDFSLLKLNSEVEAKIYFEFYK